MLNEEKPKRYNIILQFSIFSKTKCSVQDNKIRNLEPPTTSGAQLVLPQGHMMMHQQNIAQQLPAQLVPGHMFRPNGETDIKPDISQIGKIFSFSSLKNENRPTFYNLFFFFSTLLAIKTILQNCAVSFFAKVVVQLLCNPFLDPNKSDDINIFYQIYYLECGKYQVTQCRI